MQSCPSSWPALLQDSWQGPGFPPGGSHHSPEEQGHPGLGVQGYSVLSSLVGPACIFLRPSIAATQLVCTATCPTTHPPAALALSLCLSLRGRVLSGEVGAKAHRSRRIGGRERPREMSETATQGMGREVAGPLGDRQ